MFPTVQGHRVHLSRSSSGQGSSKGEITVWRSIFRITVWAQMFSEQISQLLHISRQPVATEAVGACHHKLIASHCLKPPVVQKERLQGGNAFKPKSCHLSKGIPTKEQNKSHLKHFKHWYREMRFDLKNIWYVRSLCHSGLLLSLGKTTIWVLMPNIDIAQYMLQESPRVTYTVSFTVFTMPKDRGEMRGIGTQIRPLNPN